MSKKKEGGLIELCCGEVWMGGRGGGGRGSEGESGDSCEGKCLASKGDILQVKEVS